MSKNAPQVKSTARLRPLRTTCWVNWFIFFFWEDVSSPLSPPLSGIISPPLYLPGSWVGEWSYVTAAVLEAEEQTLLCARGSSVTGHQLLRFSSLSVQHVCFKYVRWAPSGANLFPRALPSDSRNKTTTVLGSGPAQSALNPQFWEDVILCVLVCLRAAKNNLADQPSATSSLLV